MKEVVEQIVHNPKAAAWVAASTTGTGLGTFLDVIPDALGCVAALAGIVLTVILIRIRLVDLKRAELELREAKRRERERLGVTGDKKTAPNSAHAKHPEIPG